MKNLIIVVCLSLVLPVIVYGSGCTDRSAAADEFVQVAEVKPNYVLEYEDWNIYAPGTVWIDGKRAVSYQIFFSIYELMDFIDSLESRDQVRAIYPVGNQLE